MSAVCGRDCFHCPFPDCILTHVPDAEARQISQQVDGFLDVGSPQAAQNRFYYRRSRAARLVYAHDYYLANREQVRQTRRRWYLRRTRLPGAPTGTCIICGGALRPLSRRRKYCCEACARKGRAGVGRQRKTGVAQRTPEEPVSPR